MDKSKRIIMLLVLFSLVYSCFSTHLIEIKDNIETIEKVYYLENGDRIKIFTNDSQGNISIYFNDDKKIDLKSQDSSNKFYNKEKNVSFIVKDNDAKLELGDNVHLLSKNPIKYVEYEKVSDVSFAIADVFGEKVLKIDDEMDILYKTKDIYENAEKTIRYFVENNTEYLNIKGVKNNIKLIRNKE